MSLDGNIEDLAVGDILHIVSLSRKSGTLSLSGGGKEGKIFFLNGQIIGVTSSTRPAELEKALQEGREEVLRGYVIDIVFSLIHWGSGSFSFELCDPRVQAGEECPGSASLLLEQGLALEELKPSGDREPSEQESGHDLSSRYQAPREKSTSWFHLGAELLAELGEGELPNTIKKPSTPALHLLKGMLQEMNNPALGGGITLLVLRFASEFMDRAVIFRVDDGQIVGLGQFGIEPDENMSADARVRGIRIPAAESHMFRDVLQEGLARKVPPGDSHWDHYLLEHLGGGKPREIFVGPIQREGKIVALLYGDNLPDFREIGDTEPLEIFLSQAGLAMEKAVLEQRLSRSSV